MLNTADKKYINETLDRAIRESHKEFQKDTERYLGILSERHRHEMQLTRELIETRPTRDEVKDIVYEVVHKEMNSHIAVYHS